MVLPQLCHREDVKDVVVNPTLSMEQKGDGKNVTMKYKDVITDVPERTIVTEHDVNLIQDEVVRHRGYKISHSLRPTIRSGLELMKKLDIMRP